MSVGPGQLANPIHPMGHVVLRGGTQPDLPRIQALRELELLDTPPEPAFDDLVYLASAICSTPISMVTLLDTNRQFFKASIGVASRETPLEGSFCLRAIEQDGLFVVEDAAEDASFRSTPFVVGAPNIRFYAGMPLFSGEGVAVGTLCVIDTIPRSLTLAQKNALRILGQQVQAQIELRAERRRLMTVLTERREALERSLRVSEELESKNEVLRHLQVKADEANLLKSRFLANMSHELRTPLNAINGFSELLAEQIAGPLTEKQKRFVGHIRSGAKHLLQLIGDILDLSKIEAEQTKLELEWLDPFAVTLEVVSDLEPLASAKKIVLQTHAESTARLPADRRRLKQILYNLLSNALKFTPAHGVIQVMVKATEGAALFEVIDSGPGISEQDQSTIFEEFRQASAPVGTVREGTGLGLAITKGLVHKHGGSIGLVSTLGRGSRFYFTIPQSGGKTAHDRP